MYIWGTLSTALRNQRLAQKIENTNFEKIFSTQMLKLGAFGTKAPSPSIVGGYLKDP